MLGIGLMLGFCIIAPLADGIAKLIGSQVPLLQLLVVRFGVQALVLFPIARRAQRPLWWARRINRLVWLRTFLHIAGIGMMFLSLRFLPLADAIAIAFVMPFILLLLGRLLFDEEVGYRRVIACGVGFLGTLLVVQPSFANVGWPALLPIGVAFAFALFMLVTRQVAKETDPVAMQCTSGLMALAILLPVAVISPFGLHDFTFIEPPLDISILLLVLGLLGTAGHLMMTWSLKFAPASTLAPMQYLEIPMAALFGLLLFSEFPNGMALAGILVTIAAGLYIVGRERALNRPPMPPSPPPAPPAA